MSSRPVSPETHRGNHESHEESHESKRFKRTYVACLNCRVRKVKCDLGNVSSPSDRCVRCARERRDCVFVDSKKRKLAKVRSTFENASRQATPSPVVTDTDRERESHEPESAPGATIPPHENNAKLAPNSQNTLNTPKHFSTMEGALVFLANAAGKIATADERDHIDAREKHSQLDGFGVRGAPVGATGAISGATGGIDTSHTNTTLGTPYVKRLHLNKSVSDHDLRNSSKENIGASDPAVSGQPFAQIHHGSDSSTITSNTDTPSEQPPAYLRTSIPSYLARNPGTSGDPENERLTVPPVENSYSARPESTSVLSEIEYIGPHGILTAAEAEHLIEMFFSTMHPFFPHIPRFLHSPKALSGYPILLCAILTISSRYHSLESAGHAVIAKNIEIHDRLWLYVQRLISQTVWAEASTRSIGTIFAFLLFTEWNPRAIHWRWSDYANRAEDTENKETDHLSATSEPAGLGAMRRSYRMAWMLIGSAVRLAQDTGFMELSAKTFLATHVAEINSVMNMKRRSMLSHSLAELDMDTEDVSETEMENREDNEIKVLGLSEDMSFPENALQFTEAQKAQIELLQITSVGHESLYGYKAQLGSLSQRQNLSILNFMNPMINSWSRKYKKFLVPSKAKLARKVNPENLRSIDSKVASALAAGIENESFIFEFNYTKLYIYSLALSPSPKAKDGSKEGTKTGKVSMKLDEISKSAKYIEQAFNAANEILQVAHRVHKLKMLRFMPVRWVTRIVRAVAFMVKCYLTITAHKTSEITTDPSSNIDHFDATILSLSLISVEEIVQSIQKAAITLRDCSPDELHLCTRYSNVLLYLYSEMKATLKNYTTGEDVPDLGERDTQPESTEVDDPENNATTSDKSTVGENLKDFPDIGDSDMIDWFMNNRNIGLDFVGPWTELIEQQIEGQNLNLDEQLNFS